MKKLTKIKIRDAVHQKKKLKVAAYCRVSTASDKQLVKGLIIEWSFGCLTFKVGYLFCMLYNRSIGQCSEEAFWVRE